MQKEASNKIVRNLLIVFSVSTALLIVSIVASLTSISGLIDSSRWVNHTHDVLVETESLLSAIKDAETSQRGYIITRNTLFMQPYEPARDRTRASLTRLKEITVDNTAQQARLKEISPLIEERFSQMDHVLDLAAAHGDIKAEMLRGREIMFKLRGLINEVKSAESELLLTRTAKLDRYTTYAPLIILLASILSIGITILSFVRIKKETEERLKKQLEEERKYIETTSRIAAMELVTQRISDGELAARNSDDRQDEIGRISSAINKMTDSLQQSFVALEERSWLETKASLISDSVRGKSDLEQLGASVLQSVHDILHFAVGTFYAQGYNTADFALCAQRACTQAPLKIEPGSGITGEAARYPNTVVVEDIPQPHLALVSSTGESKGQCLVLLPFAYNNHVIGIMELGFITKPGNKQLQLLENSKEAIGIAISSALSFRRMQELLEETQAQSEELQAQHTELESLNEELEAQAQQLQASDEELRVQQEELLEANTLLEERSVQLQERNAEIQAKAEELELTTRYKSEFLANMSHELRTPLNSILLLGRLLSDNKFNHLNADEVEYARVIQNSGTGLLNLINEILDLSQIETGKLELDPEDVTIKDMLNGMRGLFGEVAKEKGVKLQFNIADDVPAMIRTDRMRLEQVLKNLVSNALKFTAEGSVSLEVRRSLNNYNYLDFAVKDTGVGIPADKHALIFEAFQQADGSTKRKYGGTGLGLSISKQLARLLEGGITLNSEVGKGSEFILSVPVSIEKNSSTVAEPRGKESVAVEESTSADKYIASSIPKPVADDRGQVKPGDKCILIVEDDVNFAKSLLDFTRAKGYKGIVTVRGDEAVELARQYQPKGVLLDLQLPVKSGWEVMDDLKKNLDTRHIPVHIMSSYSVKKQSLMKGAVDFIDKPVAHEQMHNIFKKIENVLNRDSKKVLIVEDNTMHAEALAYFLGSYDIQSEVKNNVADSMDALKQKDVNCVILDMGIPGNNAYALLEEFKSDAAFENLPVIIFTGKSLSMAEEQKIRKYADSIVVKTAFSYQRMLDEVSLFLHLVEEDKAQKAGSSFKRLGTLDQVLKGKTVLITDDDVRNIFSLTRALESLELNVVTAVNGKEALQKLEENSSIDIVLLDMMMPEMDGYEAARHIRENPKWKKLPVIAVTAKAMSGDREKCIRAGASDYISKPVDIDQLLSLLRVWLYSGNK